MGRPVRFLPPNSLVEITTRTLQGRFLLRPCPQVNSIMVGVTARAMKRFGMRVTFMVALSNHVHYELRPEDQKQLSQFMQYVNSLPEASLRAERR